MAKAREERKYELDELLAEANRLREADAELASTAPYNARTVYYYVQEGLLPGRSGTRGPGTQYSQQFLYKLLLIRRLQKETPLKLAQIREVINVLPADTLKATALGLEDIDVQTVNTLHEARAVAAKREDRSMLFESSPAAASSESFDFADDAEQGEAEAEKLDIPSFLRRPSAVQWADKEPNYSASERPEHSTKVSRKTPRKLLDKMMKRGGEENIRHRFPLGDGAELTVTRTLTARQLRQLDNITQVISDILDEDE